jgi:hypothetical protein
MPSSWLGTLAIVAMCGVGRCQTSTTMEVLVVEAIRDDDWQVRAAAASMLRVFGTAHHADALQGLLGDERSEVWRAAWWARLSLRPDKLDRAIGCIANGQTWADVSLLSRLLAPLVRAEHIHGLTSEYERARSGHSQYALLLLLAAAGAQLPEPAVAYVRSCEDPAHVLNATALLPLLPCTPEQKERVTGWLAHQHALVRHRCATWLLHHGATGAEVQRHVIPDHVETEVYQAEAWHAARALGAEWVPTTRAAVLDAVGKARIVLVGDSHGSRHIADLTVDCCVASLEHGERGKVAFGYEAPVEISYALAKPRAEALGLAAIPLEPVEQLPSLRSRDAAINAAIRAWLARSPEHKMVALYGWNHLLGRGHVDVQGAVRILTCPPASGLLAHLRPESLANGVVAAEEHRWFVHRTKPDTFFVVCDDRTWCPETRPAFTAWLAKKLHK